MPMFVRRTARYREVTKFQVILRKPPAGRRSNALIMEMTTDAVPEADRLAYWRQAVSRALTAVTVTARDARTFSGRVKTDQLGYLRISAVEAEPERLVRDARLVADAQARFLM